jgi:hypothetical protein
VTHVRVGYKIENIFITNSIFIILDKSSQLDSTQLRRAKSGSNEGLCRTSLCPVTGYLCEYRRTRVIQSYPHENDILSSFCYCYGSFYLAICVDGHLCPLPLLPPPKAAELYPISYPSHSTLMDRSTPP